VARRAQRIAIYSAWLVLLLGACGKSTIRPHGAERAVADTVSGQTGFRPSDVRCPAGVEAKVGGTLDCRFTGPQDRPYTAHLRIVKVQGERVIFYVSSRPSG